MLGLGPGLVVTFSRLGHALMLFPGTKLPFTGRESPAEQ